MAEVLAPKAADHRLFVTRIAPHITQQDVAAHFQQFGATTDVYLPFIPGRPGHKGFAFVSFVEGEAVQGALANAPHIIHGAEVIVDVAMSRQPGTGDTPAGPSQRPLGTRKSGGPDRIFVTRVPLTMSTAEVQNHFAQFGEVRDCYMPAIPGSGTHKGFAFISYVDPASVQAATQEQQHEINGATVVVDVALARSGNERAMQVASSGFPEAPKVVPGRLFVTKIHPEITKAELESYFGQYGELDDVYLPGKGARIAFIQFKVPMVAQQVTQQLEHVIKPGASVHVDQAVARKSDGKAAGKGWGCGKFAPNLAQSNFSWQGPYSYGMDPNVQMYQQQAAGMGFMRWNPY